MLSGFGKFGIGQFFRIDGSDSAVVDPRRVAHDIDSGPSMSLRRSAMVDQSDPKYDRSERSSSAR